MHYNPGTTHSSYQNSSFVPLFAPAFSSAAKEQEAKDVCGSNTQCLLDYSATGNEKLAKATVANTLAFTEINQLFSKFHLFVFVYLHLKRFNILSYFILNT